MPERSNGTVSKTVVLGNWYRGFESLSLRWKKRISKQKPVGQYLRAFLFVHSDELKSGLNYLLGGVSGGGDLVVLKSPPIGM